MAKPFELRVLEARVESFLEHKRCAQRDFKEEREVRTAMLKMSALDQKFLDKVISIIEHNMKKAIDIDVNTIAREVGMSKSSFYRKIKLITDLSPVEFVKNIRLKHAYELLEKGETSLESVAYSTGFSSAKYFPPVLRNSSESPRRNFYVGVNWMSDGEDLVLSNIRDYCLS